MAMPLSESLPLVGPYDANLLDEVLRVLDTLPPVQPAGSFCGGIILKAASDYLIVILLPPTITSARRMGDFFGEHYDNWTVINHEYFDEYLEVVHLILQPSA